MPGTNGCIFACNHERHWSTIERSQGKEDCYVMLVAKKIHACYIMAYEHLYLSRRGGGSNPIDNPKTNTMYHHHMFEAPQMYDCGT
jgi:hypothetical protein